MEKEKAMKNVFFTGATGGLGMASVRLLSENGWTVFAVGTNENKLNQLSEITNVIPIRADITDSSALKEAHAEVCQYTNQLNAIVNLAGMTHFGSLIENNPITKVEKLLSLNVIAMVRVNSIFFEMLEQGRGRIINCSSSAGWMKAQPFAGAYVLSKRAVEGYNDSLRRELMYLDIPVIKLQPGSFRTAITEDVETGFEKELDQTKRYQKLLIKMKPLMDSTLRNSGNPQRFAKVLLKALETRRPKLKYRVGTNFLLSLLELLPESLVDIIYRKLYK